MKGMLKSKFEWKSFRKRFRSVHFRGSGPQALEFTSDWRSAIFIGKLFWLQKQKIQKIYYSRTFELFLDSIHNSDDYITLYAIT